MTIKELAESLNVSKPTIRRAIYRLHINTETIGNRFIIDDEDAKRIKAYLRAELSENEIRDKRNNRNTESETIEKEPDAKDWIIKRLEAEIAEKKTEIEKRDEIIKSQIEQIELLIRSNTALNATVAMLEDKHQKQEIVDDKAQEAPEPPGPELKKKHWWQFWKS